MTEEIKQLDYIEFSEKIFQRKEVRGFTIDDESSQDLDDAIWIQLLNDSVELQVHITDVTELIPLDSPLETAALRRIESYYHVSPPSPMLPPEISDKKASLLFREIRPTISIFINLNSQGDITNYIIQETRLISLKKFGYREAEQAMQNPEHEFYLPLNYLNLWGQKLTRIRRNKGAIGCQNTPLGYLDENGTLRPKLVYRSEQVIQEMMLLANTVVAQLLAEAHTGIFRIHSPNLERAREKGNAVRELLELEDDLALRSQLAPYLNPAIYSLKQEQHFALAIDAYTHFTSPLRRLVDFINQRIVKALINHQPLPYSQEKLLQIISRVNQHQATVKKQKSERKKNKRKEQYQRALSASQFSHLSNQEISQLLEYACHHQRLSQLIPEVLARVNTLSPLDFYNLFFVVSEPQMQQLLVKQMPLAKTSMTLTVLQQKKGYLVDWIVEKFGQEFLSRCFVNAENKILTTQPVIAENKKQAKHQASRLWLSKYVGKKLISPQQVVRPEFSQKFETKSLPINQIEPEKNPVATLNNLCQKRKWAPPKYSFTAAENGYSCQVSLRALGCATGEGTSKRLAKAAAAALLLEQLSLDPVIGEAKAQDNRIGFFAALMRQITLKIKQF